ncbi:MAG: tetratricopeptide repeat protein, partial [Cyanobacteria bacterium J06632_3]
MTLATQLTSLIATFLPLLLTQEFSGTIAAEQAGESGSRTVGNDDWAQAQRLWQVIEPVIQKKRLAIAAAAALSEDILDEEAQANFCQQLEEILSEDVALAQVLTEILAGESVVGAESASAAVDQSQRQSHPQLEIGGKFQGNTTIIVGDGNTIAAPRPKGTVNPFGVPYSRNRYFTGREDVLSRLHEQLIHSGAAAMTQVQAISGLGGIGKTQTAVEYAYRYHYGSPESLDQQPVYDYVFWVNADTQVNLASGFAGIAEQLAVPDAQKMQQEQKIAAVRSWLNGHDRWLLIFDNADTPDWLAPWMPTNPKGKVLITSRANVFDQLGIQTPLALDVLEEADALTFLFERTGIARTDASESEAKQLNQELDGLPLALEQASAYILRQKIDFGLYLRAYRSRGLTQLEKEKAQTGRYPSSVLKTWQLNMTAVRAENPAASALLEMSAFLAPDEIPCWLLTNGVEAWGGELGDYLREGEAEATDVKVIALALRELLSLLSRYSLIWWDKTPDTYSLHRLVQAVVQSQLEEQVAADWIEQVTAAIAKAYPGEAFEQWPQCEQLLPHQLKVIEQALAAGLRSKSLGSVCGQTGAFLIGQGQYSEAEPLFLEALNISKAKLGERHLDTAISFHNLAELYRAQSRYGEAESLLLESLDIQKSELGEQHSGTAISLSSLALLYNSQSRYGEAESLLLESLNIQKSEC